MIIGDVIVAAMAQMTKCMKTDIQGSEEEVARHGQNLIDLGYMPYDAKAFELIARWLAMPEPSRGLLLTGKAGAGKTMLCKLLAKEELIPAKYRRWKMLTSSEFVAEWMDADGRMNSQFWYRTIGVYECLTKGVQLIIDDLGQESVGIAYGYREEVMDQVICKRYRDWQDYGSCNVITTNLTASELEKRYGRRVTDRLCEMCGIIEFNCKSARGTEVVLSQKEDCIAS